MTLQTQEAATSGGFANWLWDDVAGDWVPVAGNAPLDLTRGFGRFQTVPVGGATAVLSRAVVNQILPTGVAMVMSTFGPETNTFTTRVGIGGTFLNAMTYGNPTAQVAGTFPAGALNLVGRTIRVKAGGTIGTTGTPNFTFDIGLGAAGANVLATTGSLAAAAVTTPAPWTIDVTATVQTAGSSGVITSEGLFSYSTTSSVVVLNWTMGNSTRGTGLTLDLTAAQAFNIFATCGTSNASNRVIANFCTVEILY
jgi:hypothetical protein